LLVTFIVILGVTIAVDGQTGRRVVESGPAEKLVLPPPFATQPVANSPKLISWPKGKTPIAPVGFEARLFADGFENPRSLFVLPNGDILVMESIRRSGSRVILLRDSHKTGTPDRRETFLQGLHGAFGMALLGNRFYVGNTDALVVFPYRLGETQIMRGAERVLDLPGGGHYTRNVVVDPAGRKLFVSVGSSTNVDEERVDERDPRRAAILEVNPNGTGMRVFASGMRNPVGMDWEPETQALWTVVNERDLLGDELVPDYLTRVRDGAFYGWPYSYFGQNEDPRKKGQRPDLVAKAIKPDYALGSHVAPLGLAFYRGTQFPQHYRSGAFIGMHGSWNRSNLVGYKVAFVPFKNGMPAGPMEDFLTGFIANEKSSEVYGRPVGVSAWIDGSLLVADDGAGKIWRVSVKGAR
jgi:glucose/arabinose dehydrogenase